MNATAMKRRVCLPLAFSLLIGGSMLDLHAQQKLGKIRGAVLDPSGAAVPNAAIVARHIATGTETEIKSSSSGDYLFPALEIGEYTLRAALQGFKTAERTGLRVVSGESLSVDIQLTVGELTDTVEVTAEIATVDFSKTSAGTAQLSETISNLPIQVAGNARRSLDFLSTLPGVTYVPNSGAIVQGIGDAGPHRNAVMFSYDGQIASVNLSQGLRDDTGPIPDLIQEFRLATNQDAEQGWTQGTGVELITKSGTNQFHGTVYEYFRNNALDARGFIAPRVPPQKQNEYGALVSGPIYKNKHFFIGSFNGFKRRTSGAGLIRTVPTARMRNGDFGELLGPQIGTDVLGRPILRGQIYDPATTRPDGQGGFIRDPFPNNVIPSIRISPVSKFFQDLLPPATRAGTQGNWVGLSGRAVDDRDRTYVKTDHILGNHKITFGYEDTPNDTGGTSTSAVGYEKLEGRTFDARQYRVRLSHTVTLKPNLLLSTRVAINNVPRIWGNFSQPSGTIAAGVLKGAQTPEVPGINIEGGFNSFGGFIRTVQCPQGTIPASVDLSWVKGKHNMKFGAQYMHQYTNQLLELYTAGDYNFVDRGTGLPGNAATGSGYASYFLGQVNSATQWTPRAERHTSHSNGFFAQDQWKVTPKFTINYGLRWNVFVPFHESYHRTGAFSPTVPNPAAGGRLGALQFWGTGPGRNGRGRVSDINYGEFAPRLGLAYALDSKTVVRAYYGIDHYPLNAEFASGFIVPNAGFGAQVVRASVDNGLTPLVDWTNGINILPRVPNLDPSLLNGTSIAMLDPTESQAGKTQSLGFTVEREVGWATALRAEYVGKLAHGIPTNQLAQYNHLNTRHLSLGNLLNANINSPEARAAGIPIPYAGFNGPVFQALRPFPQFQDVALTNAKNGYSLYHSLQMSAQKRFGSGLSFLVSHTIQKILTPSDSGMNFNSFAPNGTIQHVTLQNQSKMLATFDRTHQFKASYSYELPFGKNKMFLSGANPFLNHVVGGWTVSGIHIYQSGTPIRVTSRQVLPGIGPVWPLRVPDRPIRTSVGCGDIDINNPQSRQFLNLDAFATAAPFTFGNTRVLPSNRDCPTFNEDISLIKDFVVREPVRLRFGAQFFNIFNRHFWTGLNTDTGNITGFGRHFGASGARSIQFLLKVDF